MSKPKPPSQLIAETLQMEQRLSSIRKAMNTQKDDIEKLKSRKNQEGNYWSNSNSEKNSKQYIDSIMQKIEQKKKETPIISRLTKTSQSTLPSSLSSQTKLSLKPSPPSYQRTNLEQQMNQSSQRLSDDEHKSDESEQCVSISQGSELHTFSTDSKYSQPQNISKFQLDDEDEKRLLLLKKLEWIKQGQQLGILPQNSEELDTHLKLLSFKTSKNLSYQILQSNSKMGPIEEDTAGSLLNGTFNETRNHNEFAKARQEWLRANNIEPNSSTKIAEINYNSSGSSPKMLSPSTKIQIAAGSMLASNEEFDEIESRRSFEEARAEFLASLNLKNGYEDELSAGKWSSEIAQKSSGLQMLWESRPSTSGNGQNLEVKRSKSCENTEKFSCYQCYRLFSESQSIVDEIWFPKKIFCSKECLQTFSDETWLNCFVKGENCFRRIRKKDAILRNENVMCKNCGRDQMEYERRSYNAFEPKRTHHSKIDMNEKFEMPHEADADYLERNYNQNNHILSGNFLENQSNQQNQEKEQISDPAHYNNNFIAKKIGENDLFTTQNEENLEEEAARLIELTRSKQKT